MLYESPKGGWAVACERGTPARVEREIDHTGVIEREIEHSRVVEREFDQTGGSQQPSAGVSTREYRVSSFLHDRHLPSPKLN